MLSIHNSYILEGFQIAHTVAKRRKRDLLQYKQELCIQLVGNYPQTCLQASADVKRRRSGEACPERLLNVGLHLPIRGEGTNHRCVVCEKRFKEAKRIDPNTSVKHHKTTTKCGQCNVYLCVTAENCFYDYHTKAQFWL